MIYGSNTQKYKAMLQTTYPSSSLRASRSHTVTEMAGMLACFVVPSFLLKAVVWALGNPPTPDSKDKKVE